MLPISVLLLYMMKTERLVYLQTLCAPCVPELIVILLLDLRSHHRDVRNRVEASHCPILITDLYSPVLLQFQQFSHMPQQDSHFIAKVRRSSHSAE